MTNTLGKLEAKGFVHIEPDPDSGRQKIVRLTPSGQVARDQAIEASYPALDHFLDAVDFNRIESVLPWLREIRQYLDERRGKHRLVPDRDRRT